MKMLYDFYDKEIARISIFIRKFYFECWEGVKNVTRDLKYAVKFLLPARASEQGNVIGSVSVYIYIYIYIYICHQKKIVIERSRDLIYLKFVATDFSLKIISPSAGENSGDLA